MSRVWMDNSKKQRTAILSQRRTNYYGVLQTKADEKALERMRRPLFSKEQDSMKKLVKEIFY